MTATVADTIASFHAEDREVLLGMAAGFASTWPADDGPSLAAFWRALADLAAGVGTEDSLRLSVAELARPARRILYGWMLTGAQHPSPTSAALFGALAELVGSTL
jgi:hypothetical protein